MARTSWFQIISYILAGICIGLTIEQFRTGQQIGPRPPESGNKNAGGPVNSRPPREPSPGAGVNEAVRNEILDMIDSNTIKMPYGGEIERGQVDIATYIVGTSGHSCDEACAAAGTPGDFECMPGFFELINQCRVVEKAFPELTEKCIIENEDEEDDTKVSPLGGSPPCASDVGGGRIVQGDFIRYPPTCSAKTAHIRRLCPCGKPTQKSLDVTDRARPMLVDRLKIRHEVEEERIADKLAGGPVNMWDRSNYLLLWSKRASEFLTELEVSSEYKVVLAEDTDCRTACKQHDRLCHREWFDVFNDCTFLKEFFRTSECHGEASRMNPRFDPGRRAIMYNQNPHAISSSCGQYDNAPGKRLCMCVKPSRGTAFTRDFHTVFNVQSSAYFEWQSRYGAFWHKKAKMYGKYTRLLSANRPDHLMDQVPTYVSPGYDFVEHWYVPYNKPLSIHNWLQNAHPREQIIVVVDPDCAFVRPLDLPVEEGRPIAQTAFFVFEEHSDSVANQIAARYCEKCAFFDPIAVPYIVHRKDMEKIAPLWLKITEEIKADSKNWPDAWDNKKLSGVTLGWTAEMFGYIFACSKLGIRHDMWQLQNVPPIHAQAWLPIIHYHVEVQVPGHKLWFKGFDNASYAFPNPVPSHSTQMMKTFFGLMKDAYETVGPPTNYTWRTSYRYAQDSIHSIGPDTNAEIARLLRDDKYHHYDGAPVVTEDQWKKANAKVIASKQGDSCDKACEEENSFCDESLFPVVNRCSVIISFYPDALYCAFQFYGADLPAIRKSTYDILLNSNWIEYPTKCHTSFNTINRMCVCVPTKPTTKPLETETGTAIAII